MTADNAHYVGPHVYYSRFQTGLVPGRDGASLRWEIGEVVEITDGQDAGRLFKITSERMSHHDAPGQFVREGYFLDDPAGTSWAKVERQLWFPGEVPGVTRR